MGRLDTLDQEKHYKDKRGYEKDLEKLQLQLLEIQQSIRESSRSIVLGYEGMDAAGKGGSIKRIVAPLDPRGYQVWPIGPPTPEELRQNYLWRFWTRMPGAGRIGIFDRTWYGRVLVERVERLAPRDDWRRAYSEINDFERTLVDSGVVLVKFWFHISPEEQLKRFKERESNPFKRWKITKDDWRNREKWDKYVKAAEEMFDKTDTECAPWHIIPGNHKWAARMDAIRRIISAFE